MLPFSKYHGAGNDFILIDGTFDTHLISRLCDRRFGIGADGVLSIEKDLRVRIFNADGSEPPFCGNGIRCAFDYLSRRSGLSELHLTMGERSYLCRREGDAVSVHLGAPKILHWYTQVNSKVGNFANPGAPDLRPAKQAVSEGNRADAAGRKCGDDGEGKNPSFEFTCVYTEVYAVDTGVPHALLFVEELETIDVAQWGKRVRTATGFNATFVQVDAKGAIAVRTYERGVEAETLACGSGAAAAAWAARRLYALEDRIEVKTRGSSLLFSFTGDAIEMVGPAVFVFSGSCVL